MTSYLKQSKDIKLNYSPQILRIERIDIHPNADNLVYAIIGEQKIIVDKSMRAGDIVAYFPLECTISPTYLRKNNLYNDPELNADKSQRGFFTKTGRVRCIKLRGEYSMGYVAPVSTLEVAYPFLKSEIWSHVLGTTFDEVGSEKIAWKYIPQVNQPSGQSRYKKSMKKLKRFDRLVEGQFRFHYDTEQLQRNMSEISPNQMLNISLKVDGTSIIISNLLVKDQMNWYQKLLSKIGLFKEKTHYDNIYSTRRVIQNQYINQEKGPGFYNVPIHTIANNALKDYIPEGYTLYGELFGYIDGMADTCIQKNHDYGCEPGKWKVMPYRFTYTNPDGDVKEFEVRDVIRLTKELIERLPDDKKDIVQPLVMLYEGPAKGLYPYEEGTDLRDWREGLLETMQNNKEWRMEMREPLCKNKVPREGVVVRIQNDPIVRAFKLKTKAHLSKETADLDNGVVNLEDVI